MTTYVATYEKFRVWAASTNGVYPPIVVGIGRPVTGPIPKLTRQQAASLIRYSVKVSPSTPTDTWYLVTLPILGYYQEGDRFKLTDAWRNGFPSPEETVSVWSMALSIAEALDARGATFTAPRPQPSVDYTFMAGQSWKEMKKRRPDDADKVLPPPTPGPVKPPGTGPVPGVPMPPPQPPLGPFVDSNGILWSLTDTGAGGAGAWQARTVADDVPYNPTLLAPTEAELREEVEKYAAEARGSNVVEAWKKKKPPASGGANAAALAAFLLVLAAD